VDILCIPSAQGAFTVFYIHHSVIGQAIAALSELEVGPAKSANPCLSFNLLRTNGAFLRLGVHDDSFLSIKELLPGFKADSLRRKLHLAAFQTLQDGVRGIGFFGFELRIDYLCKG
jgi:hypothetical protein